MHKKKLKEFNLKRSILLLLLLAVFLILSTYAWFTSNTLVKIETIQVSVATSAGFQISVDAVNWKSVLAETDITTGGAWSAGHSNHIPTGTNMKPVSTTGLVDSNGLLPMYLGTVDVDEGTGALTLSSEVSADVKANETYIAYDLFFRSNQEVDLNLNVDSLVSGGLNTAGITKGIENAARVAIVVQGAKTFAEYEAAGGVDTVRALNGGEQVIIWEPNSDSHTLAAMADALNSYGVTIADEYEAFSSYSALKAPIAVETPVLLREANVTDSPDEFGLVEVPASIGENPAWNLIQTNKPLGETPEMAQGGADYQTNRGNDGMLGDVVPLGITLQPGITKARIYMWIEGQDYDCQDFASGTDLGFDISFTI